MHPVIFVSGETMNEKNEREGALQPKELESSLTSLAGGGNTTTSSAEDPNKDTQNEDKEREK
jgi:hypothetical protein